MQLPHVLLNGSVGGVQKLKHGKSNAIGGHGGFLSKMRTIIKMLRRSNLIWCKQA
jgi:hypothetical protein